MERNSIGDECTLEINQHNTPAMNSLQSTSKFNHEINMIKEVVEQNQNSNVQNEFEFIIQGIQHIIGQQIQLV
jgi:hypothetical protein